MAKDRAWIEPFGWRSVDDVLALTSQDVAAVSRSSDVIQVSVDHAFGGPETVFVKRYHYNKLGQRIKQMFRGTLFGKSRARREYEFLHEMSRRQIPTVRPIAFGERRRGLFLRASFLITEGAEGLQSLDLFALKALRNRSIKRADRLALIQCLAQTIRNMHDAGVRHGGLFLRNILVRQRSDHSYDFVLLDPDSHSRLFPSALPPEDALADLSEMVASAMAVGLKGGLLGFLRAYWQVSRLTKKHRSMITKVLERARRLAPAEQHRLAIAETIDLLRGQVAPDQSPSTSTAVVDSLDKFFDLLDSAPAQLDRFAGKPKQIFFTVTDVPGAGGLVERKVTIEGGRITVSAKDGSKPDLTIRVDHETLLAILSGHPSGIMRVRAGGLHIKGDTRLLPILFGSLSRPPVA